MKRILYSFIFLIIIISPDSFPQSFESGAFGAPVIRYTSIAGQNSLILGGRFGWIINKSIVLGGGFYGLTSVVHTGYKDIPSGQNVMLGFNFGGLELEYIFFPDAAVHFSLDMLMAGGGTYYSVADLNIPHGSYFSQDLLVWEPSINLEFNLLSWFHSDVSFSYRMITSYPANYGIRKEDLAGPSFGLEFKFGKY